MKIRKGNYIAPTIEVVGIELDQHILAGSGSVTIDHSDPITGGFDMTGEDW